MTADCSFFDARGHIVGTGHAKFLAIRPGKYGEAEVAATLANPDPIGSVDCQKVY